MSHASVDAIRKQIDHPIIDADGHILEFMPEMREHFAEVAGPNLLEAFDQQLSVFRESRGWPVETMREVGMFRMTWWGFPARNTLDRATAMLPRLFHSRLDELGLDYAVVYPTYGLGGLSTDDQELRTASVRAANHYYAEAFSGLRDRLEPVAVIPMHTPDEAVAELDYCVGELGYKAAVLAGYVKRPVGGPEAPRAAHWIDTLGLDSLYDYDPVWAKCLELGIAPSFHSSAMGWGTRASVSSYVYNHIGNFAAAGEGTCRSLFLGGVTRRFPDLNFAFLEGGVGWAHNLLCDLIGHWEKRGRQHIHHYDPNELDRPLIRELFAKWGNERTAKLLDQLDAGLAILSDPDEPESGLDEFRHCGIEKPDDLRELFTTPYYFGCEADDPLNKTAFDVSTNPLGVALNAIFSSDVGHWDVPDMRGVLGEAWESVEGGWLSREDFRAFTFENAVSLWCRNNPTFFDGTSVESAVRAELAT
jgi:predicted TIM-barrel fold metal-dependent hydrolase